MQRIINNFKWAMKGTSHLFLVSRIKALQCLRIQPGGEYISFPCAGWWRERKGKVYFAL
jgi:hypothetical protein